MHMFLIPFNDLNVLMNPHEYITKRTLFSQASGGKSQEGSISEKLIMK